MKKIINILLLISILLGVVACGKEEVDNTALGVNIFYLNKEEDKIVSVYKDIEQGSLEDKVKSLVGLLQMQPDDIALKPITGEQPFIKKITITEGHALVELTEEYHELSPTKEVLVRAAIVRTLNQLSEIFSVRMNIGESPLVDSSGVPIGEMTADSFIDNTGSEFNDYEKVELTVFYANEKGDGLVSSVSSKVYHSSDSIEKLIVQQLIQGPTDKDLYPTINPKTKILSIFTKEGICYLNLNKEFLNPVQNATGEVAIYSLVNSLVELKDINKVQISVEGESDVMFGDRISLETVFERNLELVQ